MHALTLAVAVALAGALGAPARYALEGWVRTRWPTVTPWGTFVVNVSGSLGLGIVVGLALAHGLGADARTVAGTGFLGAYTTYSAYAHYTVRRAADGRGRLAVGYALGSVVACALAAALGLALVGAW